MNNSFFSEKLSIENKKKNIYISNLSKAKLLPTGTKNLKLRQNLIFSFFPFSFDRYFLSNHTFIKQTCYHTH